MSPMSPSTKINMEDEVGLIMIFYTFYNLQEEEEKVPLKSLKDLEEEKIAEKQKQQKCVSRFQPRYQHNKAYMMG